MLSTPFAATPPRNYGGTELMVHHLSEALAARGHGVVLFATGDSGGRSDLRALYPVAQWPPGPLADINHVTWALAQVAREPFDLVHVHSAAALGVARLMPDVPVVYTLHHVRDEALSDYYQYFPAVQFVGISKDQCRREVELPGCTVIHHGLDPSEYECAAAPRDYVCFLGRYAEIKGPHTAIDIATAAGIPIRLAGEVHPPDRAFAERELAHRFTQKGVRDLGLVGPGAKRELLAHARALLAPIEWNEPFGLVLIEAMLSGTPPIAFPRGSARELIEHGVTGFLARNQDEMVSLLQPGGAVDRFDRGRCRALASQRFERGRMAAEYEVVYAAAIAEAGGPPSLLPLTA